MKLKVDLVVKLLTIQPPYISTDTLYMIYFEMIHIKQP